jgi:DNA-binding transcriptional regulator YbjK
VACWKETWRRTVIVALGKRIDDLRKPVIAASAFMGKVQDDLIHAEIEFRRNPNLETAAAWDSAITRDKTAKANSLSFELSQQVGHEQRAMKCASIATFTPFLRELAKLLQQDIDDSKQRIARSLADIGAEATDAETVKPLPELRA